MVSDICCRLYHVQIGFNASNITSLSDLEDSSDGLPRLSHRLYIYYGVIMRCPKCNSRKYKGNAFSKLCSNCGFHWENPKYRKTTFTSEPHLGSDRTSNIVRNSEQFLHKQRDVNVNCPKQITIDYHNVAYKYPIIRDNPNVHLSEIIKMKGWNKEQEHTKDVTIQRTPKSVIFYLRKRIKKDISQSDTAVKIAETVIKQEAMAFSEKYGIELGEPEPLSKEVKIEPAFLPAGTMFKSKIAKSVYPDGQVEFIDKKDAMEHTKNFVDNMALLNRVDRIENIMEGFSENIVTHMEVLRSIREEIGNLASINKENFELLKDVKIPFHKKMWSKISSYINKIRSRGRVNE